ncbi:MAG: tetratricopeptide repeat protein, partial [Candidatus Lokiarchaeota archaeon]|nr:tetratricopeptide repeat protein [Candidatus Lokiarchaeota archaeon]
KEIEKIKNYKKQFLNYLQFELHFLKFQIVETLFSFIFALEKGDDIDLWFNLTFPKNISNRSFAVYDKISEFKNRWNLEEYLKKEIDLEQKSIPYWKYVFFYDKDISACGVDPIVIENNIIILLLQMAQTFSDREDYNAYKHGLRCYSSSMTVSIKPDNEKIFTQMGFAKNGMNFLTKSKNNGDILINSTFKSFSPKEDLYIIEEASKLLKNIINVRKSHFSEEQNVDIYYCEREKKFFYSDDYTLLGFSKSATSSITILKQADISYQKGKYEEAIVRFQKVLQVDNSCDIAIMGLGYCFYRLNKFNESINYFKKYTKNNRAEYWNRAQFTLALCYLAKNDLKSADEELTVLISQCSEDDNILTISRYLLANIKLNLNEQYFNETGKNNSSYIKSASKLLNKTEENGFDKPEIWFKLALVETYLKQYEKAKMIYKKIEHNFPDDIAAKLNLAHLEIDLNRDLSLAETYLNECLELDDNHFNTLVGLSVIKMKQKKQDECYEISQKLLSLAKNPIEKKIAFNNMGWYYFELGNNEEALKYFKNALKIDDSFDNSINGYMDCLWNQGKFNEIIEFTKNYEFKDKNKFYLKKRAYAFSQLNDHEEAIGIIDKLIELFDDDKRFLSDLYDSKADILEKKGEIDGALNYFQKSLDTGTGDYEFTPETREKLENLKAKYKKI